MGIQLGLKPTMDALASSTERVGDLRDKIEKAQRHVQKVDRLAKANEGVVAKLAELSTTHILEDEVGNFQLPAQRIVRAVAADVGLTEIEVRQVGFAMIPQAQASTEGRPFKSYNVRATVFCSYAHLTRFIDALQTQNPYLRISGIHVTTRPVSPDLHNMVLDIGWPVWASEDLKASVLDNDDSGDSA